MGRDVGSTYQIQLELQYNEMACFAHYISTFSQIGVEK